jgi:hypothetical protein
MGAHLEFRWALLFGLAIMLGGSPEAPAGEAGERVRAREFGIAPGVLTPGPLNAITCSASVGSDRGNPLI